MNHNLKTVIDISKERLKTAKKAKENAIKLGDERKRIEAANMEGFYLHVLGTYEAIERTGGFMAALDKFKANTLQTEIS